MTAAERQRIRTLGRVRAGELLAVGLMVRKAPKIQALGWPKLLQAAS